MKQKLRWNMHVLSSKLNKFICYNGSLGWNFEPLVVNGNTVVLYHVLLKVIHSFLIKWSSDLLAHNNLKKRSYDNQIGNRPYTQISSRSLPSYWKRSKIDNRYTRGCPQSHWGLLAISRRRFVQTEVKVKVKVTPIILLKPCRQLLALCNSEIGGGEIGRASCRERV